MSFFSGEEDSFIIVEDTPEETIGQLSLDSLTVDQAVYTIGTLTQRIEQLTSALEEARSGNAPTLRSSRSSLSRDFRSSSSQVNCSMQTESSDGIDESSMAAPQTENFFQQTSLVEEMPATARETIQDLQTAMQRLSAEKMSNLTTLAERERRLNAVKEELRKAKSDRVALEEVLQSHTEALERTEMALSEARAELAAKEEIVCQLEADLAASKEEAVSLRFVAQMVMDDKDTNGAEMVDRNQPPLPSISYPYHSVPPDRRQW